MFIIFFQGYIQVQPLVCVIVRPLDTGLPITLIVGDELVLDARETVRKDTRESDYE